MLHERFDGGPAGVESIAAAMAEDRGTLEDVIEPYLIQQGYVVRTARGRMLTQMAIVQMATEHEQDAHGRNMHNPNMNNPNMHNIEK